jgi:hypothetical protein
MHSAMPVSQPLEVLLVQAAAETGHLQLMPAVELCNSVSEFSGICIAGNQHQIQCCGRLSAAGHRHFMHPANARPSNRSRSLFARQAVNQRRPPRSSSRHNLCGHTSEFLASTFATADQLKHALVLVSARAGLLAVPVVCRASAAILNTPPGPPSIVGPAHCPHSVRP